MKQIKISKSITNRESESLERYLSEISKVDMISAEEEVILAQRVKTGDMQALQRLTKANLRFVVSVAKQYQNQGLSLNDLINEGNLGLIKAAQKFDETKGFKFISYAVWWIRQSIIQALSDQSRLVRLPLNKVGQQNRIHRAGQELEQMYERVASPEEIAQYLDIDLDEVIEALSQNNRHISLDAPVNDTDDGTMIDIMCDPNAEPIDKNLVYKEGLKKEIVQALNQLTIRQREVLCMFYGFSNNGNAMSLEDIGQKFELTRERVRQIRDKAILKLRITHNNNSLRTYLG
jgi:RNA polymerase primary sigma factor